MFRKLNSAMRRFRCRRLMKAMAMDGRIPVGCDACGGPYPLCCDSCPLFDD